MRIVAVFLLVISMLSGCSNKQQTKQAMDFRQKLTNCNGYEYLCTVTADYLDKLYSFTLNCRMDDGGNMSFCVEKPESIQGITGKIDNEGGKLTFDDQVLAFELMADGYVTPVSAPWLVFKALRSGYILSCGQDGDLTHITVNDSYEEDALQIDAWIDINGIPVRGEVLWQGRRIMSVDVSRFSFL